MKVVILAGGLGTRLAEETDTVPKPMVEVGDRPILFHIMSHYASQGFNDFVIALGYKGRVIKRYMLEARNLAHRHTTIDMTSGEVTFNGDFDFPDWTVHLLETGLHTMTAGRVRQALPLLDGEPFMLTYGDGLSDIDLGALLDFHRSHGKLATLSIVRPTSLFGHLQIEGDQITEFIEKPQTLGGWINGGFMVMEPGVADYLAVSDDTPLERDPLENLAKDGQLMAYRHHGFWQCMDSLKDKRLLEQLWEGGNAPWKTWAE